MTSEFGIAVHALVYLNHKGRTLSSEELAVNICTNPARVRKIMACLRKAGLLSSKEGLEGGYLFEHDAGEVTLCDIAQAVRTCFVSSSWKSGDKHMACLVASGMADILDGIYQDLDEGCKERLKGITIQDLDREIFGGGPRGLGRRGVDDERE